MSCKEKIKWIKIPIFKKSKLLKIAWLFKWKKVKILNPKASVRNINESWFNVDSAITFFKSTSVTARSPEKNKVNPEKIKIKEKKKFIFKKNLNWIIMKTPAVTNVDECTSAEIGVGADIAIGNHTENGNWALLVKDKNTKVITINLFRKKKVSIV